MDNESVCWKCNYFMVDRKDFDTGYGVCMYDSDKFEPYTDEIYETNDFSSCFEIYDAGRISGQSNACENYEESEIIEFDDELTPEEIRMEPIILELQHKNIECFEKQLYSENFKEKRNAVDEIIKLIYVGNKMAYEALFKCFTVSSPAKTIEEVHLRLEIIEALKYRAKTEDLVECFINELLKTQSNNTTRQIYQKIFDYFLFCPNEIIKDPLLNYLDESKCSYRIRERVFEILERQDLRYD